MRVYTENGIMITLSDESLSEGGEGKIFKVMAAPPQYQDTCVKIYHDKHRTTQKAEKLRYMVQNPPSKIRGTGFLIGWPIAVIYDSTRHFLGFMMYLAAKDSRELVNLTSTKISNKLGPEWHQFYDRSNGIFALISRLKLIHNIAIPIYLLHSTDKYVLKDFKPQNVLVTRNGVVTLVDMDSIQITEGGKLLYPGDVLTPMYIPPEYYTIGVGKDIKVPLDKSWDSFAIGVVFYQIMFGLHPYVVTPKFIKDDSSSEIVDNIAKNLFPFGNNTFSIASYPPLHDKFKVLPEVIQNLFRRSFSSIFSDRPSAKDWGQTISEEIKKAPQVPLPPLPHPIPPKAPRPKPVTPDPHVPPTPPIPYNNDTDWGAIIGWILAILIGAGVVIASLS